MVFKIGIYCSFVSRIDIVFFLSAWGFHRYDPSDSQRWALHLRKFSSWQREQDEEDEHQESQSILSRLVDWDHTEWGEKEIKMNAQDRNCDSICTRAISIWFCLHVCMCKVLFIIQNYTAQKEKAQSANMQKSTKSRGVLFATTRPWGSIEHYSNWVPTSLS